MNIQTDCIACIFNQALRVTKVLGLDQNDSKAVLDIAAQHVPQFSFDLTPPQNATPLYQEIASYLKRDDLYAQVKKESIIHAQQLKPKLESILKESGDDFVMGTKIAVLGNVIDLASEVQFDLDKTAETLLQDQFAIDNTSLLYNNIQKSKTLVYLADNAGENIFDALYIAMLKRLFPQLQIYYFVRGEPIINDLTLKDLENDPLLELADVVDSGVPTPGIVYELMHHEAKAIFDRADCIISKGMGNYECLSDRNDLPLFFLLKVKCGVVASSLNRQIGDIICKKA